MDGPAAFELFTLNKFSLTEKAKINQKTTYQMLKNEDD